MRFPFFRNRDSVKNGILISIRRTGDGFHPGLFKYHTTTWEGIVALDDDMIIHVAPASAGAPVPELTRAFIVPKGTMVKINAAIWHLCPLPLNNEVLHAMIILPECTYANDCTVVDFEEKDWFKITV